MSEHERDGSTSDRSPASDTASPAAETQPTMAGNVAGHLRPGALQRKVRQRALQRRARGDGAPAADAHATAQQGFSDGARDYPHHDAIAKSFGGPVQAKAHTGAAATASCETLGAEAYASGDSVAFRDSAPSLHTAAHEAAHVVQQQSGSVQLKGGFGEAGDHYEQHADAVADAVVQGRSAAPLLAPLGGAAGGGTVQKKSVQLEEHTSGPGKSTTQVHSQEAAFAGAPDRAKAIEDLKHHNKTLGKMWIDSDAMFKELSHQHEALVAQTQKGFWLTATIKSYDALIQGVGALVTLTTPLAEVDTSISAASKVASKAAHAAPAALSGAAKKGVAAIKAAAGFLRKANPETLQFILKEIKAGGKDQLEIGKEIWKDPKERKEAIDAIVEWLHAGHEKLDIGLATRALSNLITGKEEEESEHGDEKSLAVEEGVAVVGTSLAIAAAGNLAKTKNKAAAILSLLLPLEAYAAKKGLKQIEAKQKEIEQAMEAISECQIQMIHLHKEVNHAYWSLSQFLMTHAKPYAPPYPVAAPGKKGGGGL